MVFTELFECNMSEEMMELTENHVNCHHFVFVCSCVVTQMSSCPCLSIPIYSLLLHPQPFQELPDGFGQLRERC